MTPKKIFKALLAASWILIIASLISWHFSSSKLPDLLQQYQRSLEDSPQTIMDNVLFVLVLIAFILFVVSNVGLFRFRLWARPLYLTSYAGVMILVLLHGEPTVDTAIEEFMGELATLVSGAIIGLSYLPSIKEEFREFH